MGPNTFSEPWHLPHSPPEQITDIVYAFFPFWYMMKLVVGSPLAK